MPLGGVTGAGNCRELELKRAELAELLEPCTAGVGGLLKVLECSGGFGTENGVRVLLSHQHLSSCRKGGQPEGEGK